MIKKALEAYQGVFEQFIGILVFDFLIGNTDRHQSNWALICENDKWRLSPLDANTIGVYSSENRKIGDIPRYYCEGILQLLKDGRKVQCFVNNVDKDKSCHECIRVDLVVN